MATIEESQCVLDKIVGAMDSSREFVRQSLLDGEESKAGRWAIKFFSDNLAIGFPIDAATVERTSLPWFVIQCAQRTSWAWL